MDVRHRGQRVAAAAENSWRKERFGLWVAALAVIGALLFWLGEKWAESTAAAAARGDAAQLAAGNALLFNSELRTFRLLPLALSEYPDVSRLLAEGSPAGVINDRLERLAAQTRAAAIYVIRPDGLTVAASNYRLPTSFIGQNYAFRPYFRNALRNGDAELFALGTVSGRPGLYLARRVGDATRPLGVIVVKIEFDALQREWASQPGPTMVVDRNAIVIVSGRPDWQFRTVRELAPAERASIEADRLFVGAPLRPLPFDAMAAQVSFDGARHSVAQAPVALAGSQLVTLMPLDRALAAARAQSRVVVVTLLFLLIGLLAWLFRQRERAASQQAVQRELECKVAERTADLEAVNRQLVIESSERAAADARYRQSREELAQVNRLGTLGQVTAGVAHEINQPLAAIRTFAENASRFLGQGKAEKTAENLTHIVRLTERIATITAELRNFARRRTPAIGATSLADAIEGSLLLVKHRITSSKVSIKWAKRAANLTVRADRIRLEQIFVNLIQNSLDALSGRSDGVIELAVRAQGDDVIVLVADNGPGLPPDLQATLFMPFSTGKGDGLGLGLAIVRDIARAFGGDIALVDGPGARFELRLVKA